MSASKTGSSTIFTADCTIRSRTAGIDSGLCAPSGLPGLGISTRRAGSGRYRPSLSSLASSPSSRVPRTARPGPKWSCRCPVRRYSHAPSPTHAGARPCGRPCLPARGTFAGIGLGRPVQRMLQGTNRISRDTPARSLRGGTSPSGTHRAPPQQCCASTKQRPFPSPQVVLSCGSAGTTAASDAHPASDPLPGLAGYRTPRSGDTSAGHRAGEGLPSSRRHYLNVPRPIRRGVPDGCASRLFTASMAFTVISAARLPLLPPTRAGPLTTLQISRNAADCPVAPPNRAFDAGLRTRPFPDETASLLPGLLAATRTGLSPASDESLQTI